MYIKSSENEYGTGTAHFKCDTCGNPYTITPHPEDENIKDWQNCMDEQCSSYDASRDADAVFCSDEELKEKKLVDMRMLRERKRIRG